MILKILALSSWFQKDLIGNLVFLEYQKETREDWNATV